MRSSIFRFHKGDHIGTASAEDDTEFLSKCYVDTGELAILKDIKDNHVIVLGRTGTGKSALLKRLAEVEGDQAIFISPESLALAHVSNSTILNFFADLGVNLDPFFKLLWRHVFTVEILSRHFAGRDTDSRKTFWEKITAMFMSESRTDKKMREALDYLNHWGKSFWLETEYRIKEITKTLETKLDAEIKASIDISGASLAAGEKATDALTLSEKGELRARGQKVVAEAQVQDLHHVMDILDRVLDDRQKRYFILIDGLDENWVEERLRYRFIMALILTAREFIRIRNAKVILALRRDLIDRVFRLARDAGFQEEKYRSLYLQMSWSSKQLIEVLNRRISALVSRRYTKQTVTHLDLLPKQFNKVPISEYILTITTTPRDIIALFNECIAVATEQRRITASAMKTALGQYSRLRLRALGDEWSADYPALLDFAKILQNRSVSFKLSTMVDSDIQQLCLDICAADPGGDCILKRNAMGVVDCLKTAAEFKIFLMQVFYLTGLVGLKLAQHEKPSWAGDRGSSVSSAEITPDVSVVVHPKYHRALGIRP